MQLGLTALAAATAAQSVALLLKLRELAPGILHAAIHADAFRAANETLAENEETLEAACVLHRGAGAFVDFLQLGNLALDGGHVGAAPTAAGTRCAGELALKLEAADLLLAHGLSEGQTRGAKDERPGQDDRHGKGAPHLALNAQAPTPSLKKSATIIGYYAPLGLAVNAA